ncbi:nicotinate-nucleotide adenylyltransferase [Mesobacillus subterraneus]|uniref:Probable nicotinate-nucleotide adenylyltransferase n=2 Tax=Mesobacillus TaxID=2675231 RepID=A0A0D6Z8E8_9BACI|nr:MULTISPECIES: nicotinate-nucleotide adenylyltransferase [Mesobacillus]KIY22074.1 nicotinate-nucleotide adenylyltransferase [Mesobacillus subterraneus]MDQ0414427.1 nicotinate-nucleotide adenylyltransferase [Mesobacillus stamsii]
MKKVGILGGTFNPPHTGHLVIANEVLQTYGLDEIWFMPNQVPPHKIVDLPISNSDRLRMIELAIADNHKFRLETKELDRSGPSYTYETMKILKDNNKDIDFYFIIGGDMVEYLPKWRKIDELLKMVKFVGVSRPSYSMETNYDILFAETPQMDISSRMIRERVKAGRSTRYLLPESVRIYIEEHGLYGA